MSFVNTTHLQIDLLSMRTVLYWIHIPNKAFAVDRLRSIALLVFSALATTGNHVKRDISGKSFCTHIPGCDSRFDALSQYTSSLNETNENALKSLPYVVRIASSTGGAIVPPV